LFAATRAHAGNSRKEGHGTALAHAFLPDPLVSVARDD
jgi:hypothetical protein